MGQYLQLFMSELVLLVVTPRHGEVSESERPPASPTCLSTMKALTVNKSNPAPCCNHTWAHRVHPFSSSYSWHTGVLYFLSIPWKWNTKQNTGSPLCVVFCYKSHGKKKKKSSPPAMPVLRMSRMEWEWFLTLISHFALASNSGYPVHEKRMQQPVCLPWERARPCQSGWNLFCLLLGIKSFSSLYETSVFKGREIYSRRKIKSLKCIANSEKKNPQKRDCVSLYACACLDQYKYFIYCQLKQNFHFWHFWTC